MIKPLAPNHLTSFLSSVTKMFWWHHLQLTHLQSINDLIQIPTLPYYFTPNTPATKTCLILSSLQTQLSPAYHPPNGSAHPNPICRNGAVSLPTEPPLCRANQAHASRTADLRLSQQLQIAGVQAVPEAQHHPTDHIWKSLESKAASEGGTADKNAVWPLRIVCLSLDFFLHSSFFYLHTWQIWISERMSSLPSS